VCVCACVCICARESEKELTTAICMFGRAAVWFRFLDYLEKSACVCVRVRKTERERERVCVCVCVIEEELTPANLMPSRMAAWFRLVN